MVASKSNAVIEKIQSISSTSSSIDVVQSLNNYSFSVEEKDILVSGLKKLVLESNPMERIRLLTICPAYW